MPCAASQSIKLRRGRRRPSARDDELQAVIDDTQYTLDRFEATGMDQQMPEDYETLLAILDDAVKQQREHMLTMLGGSDMPSDSGW